MHAALESKLEGADTSVLQQGLSIKVIIDLPQEAINRIPSKYKEEVSINGNPNHNLPMKDCFQFKQNMLPWFNNMSQAVLLKVLKVLEEYAYLEGVSGANDPTKDSKQ